MKLANEPIVEHYKNHTLHIRRVKGSGQGGYYTCIAYRKGHQHLYSYGSWTRCLSAIRSLIDEEMQVEALLKMRLSQAQSA